MKRFCLIATLFLYGCSTPNMDNLPSFRYVDSLTMAREVHCASTDPMHCMACALQGEAANQPARGIYAVGMTVMTRAEGEVSQICTVTKARRQFEGMRRHGRMKVSVKVWRVTEHIVESRETGWTHFWSPISQAKLRRAKPYWATRFEKRQCKKEKIGDHIFFNTNQCKYNRSMRLNASSS
jgi:spore germination cell wall hydrolase CwlJ-like protein